jgi:2-iminoacetate synthase
MKFHPEKYRIPDEPMRPFIDAAEIWQSMYHAKPDKAIVREIIAKSHDKNRLTMAEASMLVNADDPSLVDEIKDGAKQLKESVYGSRIVLFAPLYVGNKCMNNCRYCGFRISNKEAIRKTLDHNEIVREVEALEDKGQKRLILVFGEHTDYNSGYIADVVRTVYAVKKGKGEVRRVNINAAPLDIDGFRTVKEAGIGTYQIFQETYHPVAYTWYHPSGPKRDFDSRLTSLDRAQEAGLDDVGIGALFGLYDWRFEVLALIRHANHLEACYNIGPHTISFPRFQEASLVSLNGKYKVPDEDFTRLIAILRLAVPYTGLILTAREHADIRKEAIQYGVSQIDAGTRLELGAYAKEGGKEQNLHKEQFRINDNRSLNDVMEELIGSGYIPSFCTACYRLGRTGEHFMEFSVPGFIKHFCSPNAMLTLAEYLMDYAPEQTAEKGWKLIESRLGESGDHINVADIRRRIERIKAGERDLYY